MAGFSVKTYIEILLRQARASSDDVEDQKAFLAAIITGSYTATAAGGYQITSANENGKSLTLSAVQGASQFDLMLAAETALQYLEAGLVPIASGNSSIIIRSEASL